LCISRMVLEVRHRTQGSRPPEAEDAQGREGIKAWIGKGTHMKQPATGSNKSSSATRHVGCRSWWSTCPQVARCTSLWIG
jgi:IS5 family transposase